MSKILLLFCVLSAIPVSAQITIFIAEKDSGYAVEGAAVLYGNSASTSDSDGKVVVNTGVNFDTLFVSHVSYKTEKIPVGNISEIDTFFLIPKIHEQEDIIVESEKKESITHQVETIELSKYNTITRTVGDILQDQSTLFIRDYGGEGASKTISARGLGSENTIVLFNEARITDVRSGAFDFSLLSSNSIDEIVYDRQSEYLPSAGGVVRMKTDFPDKDNAVLGLRMDAFGMTGYILSGEYIFGNIFFSATYDRSHSKNDYPYSFEDDENNRVNAHFSKSFLSFSTGYRSENSVIKMYAHSNVIHTGIPGYVVSNNTESSRATNDTESYLVILNMNHALHKHIFIDATLNYHKQRLKIYDPDEILLFNSNNAESDIRDAGAHTKVSYSTKSLQFRLGYEFQYSDLEDIGNYLSIDNLKKNMNRITNRIYFSASSTLEQPMNHISKIVFTASVGEEYVHEWNRIEDNSDAFSWRAGVALFPDFVKNITIKANLMNTHRLPTFNERYYSSLLSNGDVQREKYNGYDVGMNWRPDIACIPDISVMYFDLTGTNRIVWLPTRLALQAPTNMTEIQTTGIETVLRGSIWNNLISYSFLYVYNSAVNKSAMGARDQTYNKQLVYTPKHRWNTSITLSYDSFIINVMASAVGKTYYTSDNTEENALSAYLIFDVSASYHFLIAGYENMFTLRCDNILNEEYYVIQSYPMPLRNISLHYKMHIE